MDDDRTQHGKHWLIGALAFCLPALLGWGAWVTTEVMQTKWEVERRTLDRLTGSMFVEIQDELNSRNPDIKWLDAATVRRIQRQHSPYRSD